MSSGKKGPRILFVQPQTAHSIQTDFEILSKYYDVRVVDVGKRGNSLGGKIGAAWELFRGALWSDVCFASFAEVHTKWMIRFCRLFGRPSLVMVGGYEVAKVPEIGYGSLLDPKKTKVVRYIHEKATRVLPVDVCLKTDAMRNLGVDGRNIMPLPTGYDATKFFPKGAKERMALTVGLAKESNIRRKGWDVFVKAAAYLPDVKFVLIGVSESAWAAKLRESAPSNVEFISFVSDDELVRYYQRAKVYCQLSLYEGLPNVLCEAMLCECVPVGTKICGIPTAIGDTGFYAPVGDPKGTADAIRQALTSGNGKLARERIVNVLPVEKREKELVKLVTELLG